MLLASQLWWKWMTKLQNKNFTYIKTSSTLLIHQHFGEKKSITLGVYTEHTIGQGSIPKQGVRDFVSSPKLLRIVGQKSVSGRSCDRPPRHRFSWFPCVYKRMLRWFARLPVATACFSCSPPGLNFLVPYFIFMYMHNNHCHGVTAHLQIIQY